MSSPDSTITVLCFGDVVGRSGRLALKQALPELRQGFEADLVIANGENAAGGAGLDAGTARELFESGVDLMTLGDHTWQKKDLHSVLERDAHRLIRPENYAPGAPGRGWLTIERKGVSIGVFNLMGRVFMNLLLDCPFAAADRILDGPLADCTIRICDMHAEATSEKIAMGRYLDGRTSLVFGTHTHVQTSDESILAGGTAYITDLGMSGSADGVIGMDGAVALKRFLTGRPHAYQVADGDGLLCGVAVRFDAATGRALEITRIRHQTVGHQTGATRG